MKTEYLFLYLPRKSGVKGEGRNDLIKHFQDLTNLGRKLYKYNNHNKHNKKGELKMIFTIGYQGKDVESFVNILKSNDIKVLIDVRDAPISRKKGFSKNQLSGLLEYKGIKYIHTKELGDPKELRKKIKNHEISWQEFRKKFLKLLDQRTEIIRSIVNMNHTKNICLMCYEADYRQCHRSLISEVIEEKFDEKVIHL